MSLGEMQFDSQVLGRQVSVGFSVPAPSVGASFPAVLLLPGRGANHRSWLIDTRVSVYLRPLPLVAILPDGGVSDWSNFRIPGERYEDFVMEDLIPTCEHAFPIRSGRWAASGWSMDAVGALHLGLKHPDRFLSIAAHCPPVVSPQYLVEERTDLTSEARCDADLYAHAELAVQRAERPVVSIDCGAEDAHLSLVHAFHDHLDTLGYPHEYRESRGGHDSAYWDGQIRRGLGQHMAVLQNEKR